MCLSYYAPHLGKSLRLLLGLCLLAVLTPVQADLVVTGSSTILPVVKRVAVKFTAATGIKVQISGGGSDHGVKSAIANKADIGMVSRQLHEDEAKALVATTIALDAVALYVHERNAIAGLTCRQIADIYTGKISRWRELDATAADNRIYPVGKWHGRSTRELFDGFFGLRGKEYPDGTHMIGANVASILYVSLDPYAIGYVSVGSLDHAEKHGAPLKVLPVDGIAPSQESILSGRYPYVRPLNLVTRGSPQGEALRFMEWIAGPTGQQAARDEGFMIRTAVP